MSQIHICCPKCGWIPDTTCRWYCTVCKTKWNTFDTSAQCPTCGKIYTETACLRSRGGCGEMSLHSDWYIAVGIKDKPKKKFNWFWKKQEELPVTPTDKEWTENALLFLADMFDPIYFKTFTTITPDKVFFGKQFGGTEDEVKYLFETLAFIMHIDAWEIQLKFFSNRPTKFSEGIVETPTEKLNGGWSSSPGKYIDNGFGNKEIWIELDMINDPVSLISTMSHQLALYKLLGEGRLEEKDDFLAAMTAVAFGFGIFIGNSYFKFSQWTGTSHQGWQMQKSGFLPEQMIAYAMAWLAHYRDESPEWKHHLNKTMRKYFDQSYDYINQHSASINWPGL